MKSIFIKEGIKLRNTLLSLAAIHMCAVAYFILSTRSAFLSDPANGIWFEIISRNIVLFGNFSELLMVTGLALGIMQFYPETASKRFRISCHLPVTEFMMTSSLLVFGFISLSALWVFDTVVVYFVMKTYFPVEIYGQVSTMMFFWYMTAVAIYAYASILTLEPSWIFKAILGVMLAPTILLIDNYAYYPEKIYLVYIALIALVYMLVFYYPALRFRTGE